MTDTEMPPALKALNYSAGQLAVVARYWGERIRFAEQQRNAVLSLAVLVSSTLTAHLLSAHAGTEDAAMSVIMKWAMPVGLAFSTALLVGFEFMIYRLNQLLTAEIFGMNSKQVDMAISLGNSVAWRVLTLRSWRPANPISPPRN